MQSRKSLIAAAVAACFVVTGGLALGGESAAVAKKKGGSKSVRVANGKARTIPDATADRWGVLSTSLSVGKRLKGAEVADVRLMLRTTGLSVGAAGDLRFRVTAPNGRTVDIAGGFTGQSIGPLTLTANSRARICNSPPCSDPDATLGPPYFGTLGDPNLALLDGVGAAGRWVVTTYDQSTGENSVLNSVALLIGTRR